MSTPNSSKFIAQHTVVAGDTLSHIALKYYGSAIKEKWMLIYEANKDTIGDNPNLIQPGMVLNIPPQDAPTTASSEPVRKTGSESPQSRPERKKFESS
ncbi:MAG: LysM peptidoglycan-binding domain-containing protein [Anaerolineales bacterium]